MRQQTNDVLSWRPYPRLLLRGLVVVEVLLLVVVDVERSQD